MARARKTGGKHRSKPDPMARVVGQRVRKLRLQQDFTFDAFVEETGLGRGYISELERGLVVPTIHTLRKIATALEVTVADLVLEDSLREQVFEATLGLSAVDLRRLLDEVQTIPVPKKDD